MTPIQDSVAPRGAGSPGRGRRRARVRLLVVSVVAAGATACVDAVGPSPLEQPAMQQAVAVTAADNVVMQWNAALLDAIRASQIGPPQTARALAIAHTAMYDAWAAYDDVAVGTRFGGSLRRPEAERTLANRNEAISFAAYRTLVDLYPARAASFGVLMQALGYDPANTTTSTATAAGIGNVIAADLIAYRRGDGANQDGGYADYSGYVPVNTADAIVDAERWQPLRNLNGSVQTFLVPHWQNVLPFGLSHAAQFRPRPPAPLKSGEYNRQAQEVIDMSAKLTDRQKVIVEYWMDGPQSELPPGHWNLLAQVVSRRDGHSLEQDVKMFFLLNHALCDASIAAWDAKRVYDYVRPITAIRHLKRGKKMRAWAGPYRGAGVVDGEDWHPYQLQSFITPPFSEYVSGHSTFSAASAEVLKRFTGSDDFGHAVTIPAGSSKIEPGNVPARPVTLSWATFSDAADEAGISRRYGGIHFRDGDLEGRILGRRVGAAVWDRAQRYFNGTL